MSKYRFNRVFLCPWCEKGKILSDGKGKVTVSVQCPRCGRFFIGDLDTLKTERASACKMQKRAYDIMRKASVSLTSMERRIAFMKGHFEQRAESNEG